jgi:hypothetical protein
MATAYFHYSERRHETTPKEMFKGLAKVESTGPVLGMVRPAGHNRSLQWLQQSGERPRYFELDERLNFNEPAETRIEEVEKICKFQQDFEIDDLSVIIEDKTGKYRIPKGHPVFDQRLQTGWPRGIREIESERTMLNAHGTFYEFPREAGFLAIKPVATHNRLIADFCTWRGLLVLSGVDQEAEEDGHVFRSADGLSALWFGAVDDLWSLGKPRGTGAAWKNTAVSKGEYSLPYLMTGYDQKRLILSADKDAVIRVEVNFDLESWYVYDLFKLAAREELAHDFPPGFSAHWIRFSVDRDCKATAWLIYD